MRRTIYTIGYEGSQVGEFVRTLKLAGVRTLVDVRELPLSRKRGFSKTALRGILEGEGIAYAHLRGLGDPKAGRDAAKGGNDRLFRRIFTAHMATPVARSDLSVAAGLMEESAICLMCFESDHRCCHRSIVANHLVELTGCNVHNLSIERNASIHEPRSFSLVHASA